MQDDINTDEHTGWIPDPLAESSEQTFAAFDRSVGGAATFDGDAFEAIRNGTARYDANRLPPLVSWPSLKMYLQDMLPHFKRRRKEGLWKPPWAVARELGVDMPPANQLSYNSCSPKSFEEAMTDLQLIQIGNRGDELKFERFNGWYSYILTQKKYGGSLRSGRTMSAPARLAREVGQYRASVVGDYAKTAGTWNVDEKADPDRALFQACYSYIGDLAPDEFTDAAFLSLWCDMVNNVGTSARFSQSATLDGHPIGTASRGVNHAQRDRGVIELRGVEYVLKGNTHGIVSTSGTGADVPRDTMLVDRSVYVRSLGIGYHDGLICVYVEGSPGPEKHGGLPT